MDSLEINKNSCRICLDQGASVDWNDEILDYCSTTYKYCYYKYTQLEENDTFSQLLCQTCSYDLKNFHFLIEKALESHKVLQQTFAKFSQPIEIDEKFDISLINEPIRDDGDFKTINIENSAELFEDDDDNIDLLQLSKVEVKLETPKEIKKERVNKKTKIKKPKKETSKKNSQDLKKHRDTKKSRAKKIQLKNHNHFPEDVEETIDVPKPEDIGEDSDIPQSSPLRGKSVPLHKRQLTCAYCPKLIAKEKMKRHEETHKEHRERSMACTICGLKFFDEPCLNIHMSIHNENREKKHKCEFCDKSYFHRGALNVHRRLHLGQLIPCPACTQKFYRQIDLDRHKARIHSRNTEDKHFVKNKYLVECKECGKNVYSDRFKHHMALHSNNFQMKCTLCDKHFASKVSCHNHVRRLHKYRDDVSKVVEYYGEDVKVRYTHLMMKQTQIVKEVSELEQ